MTEELTGLPAVVGDVLPTPEMAKGIMEDLQAVMNAVLDDADYATIRGRRHRKRSAFTKLRRVFNVSVDVLSEEWEDLGGGAYGYRVSVRASFPDGRYEDGDGYCDSEEMATGNINVSRHNVRAKAITRAKNRATADLLGTGEVSAEEMQEGQSGKANSRGNEAPVTIDDFCRAVAIEHHYYKHAKHVKNTMQKLRPNEALCHPDGSLILPHRDWAAMLMEYAEAHE